MSAQEEGPHKFGLAECSATGMLPVPRSVDHLRLNYSLDKILFVRLVVIHNDAKYTCI